MGTWAKSAFGAERFADIGVVVTGTNAPEVQDEILRFFDKVLFKKDSVYHPCLAEKDGVKYPIVFNVYGAPAMVDVMTEMHDGGCRVLLFVGYAYGGFKNLPVGSVVLPEKSYHFDGLYHGIHVDKEAGYPDKELQQKLSEVCRKENLAFVYGTNISVPAVSFQLPHDNEFYRKLQPSTCEMELAAFYSRAQELGIRGAAALVISDNRTTSIGDSEKRIARYEGKKRLLKAIIEHLAFFTLPPLKTEKEFTIAEHLASIIHDPLDEKNVYRDGVN
jgi:purine-nucleoside phosphorylase